MFEKSVSDKCKEGRFVMKKLGIILVVCFVLLIGSYQLAFSENVALGKPAGYYGTDPAGVGGTAYNNAGWDVPWPPIVPSITMTDGVFLSEGTQWNHGTFWWDASDYPDNVVGILLGSEYKIDKFVVQADNNDAYAIDSYLHGTLQATTIIPAVAGWGMMTREIILGSPITANQLAFLHPDGYAGDYLYSVSEIQAFGTPVPEPATVLLIGCAFIGLVRLRRKFIK